VHNLCNIDKRWSCN